jgi:NAD(P)-dependent dehydrogenase (short-subunit alcohol dehydrogenase family)
MSPTNSTIKPGAIITGAASGVGLALTKHLLDQGWSVVMMDVNPEGEQIAETLGEDVLWLSVDIAIWTDVVKAFAEGKLLDPTIPIRSSLLTSKLQHLDCKQT